ncbi:hypothetical protein SAMN04487905_101265 [Actinopolyspora xinjiangensis]|uniref:Uncharacterized protein n=1 Tax=Actinopolyspora xinjiangensis TaxID=405564 RepID=A0A1H0NUN9_9ACTN|nr:hypothetical protein SAMN04487905_101265 [Actinopolyspora xinjiangensis]
MTSPLRAADTRAARRDSSGHLHIRGEHSTTREATAAARFAGRPEPSATTTIPELGTGNRTAAAGHAPGTSPGSPPGSRSIRASHTPKWRPPGILSLRCGQAAMLRGGDVPRPRNSKRHGSDWGSSTVSRSRLRRAWRRCSVLLGWIRRIELTDEAEQQWRVLVASEEEPPPTDATGLLALTRQPKAAPTPRQPRGWLRADSGRSRPHPNRRRGLQGRRAGVESG